MVGAQGYVPVALSKDNVASLDMTLPTEEALAAQVSDAITKQLVSDFLDNNDHAISIDVLGATYPREGASAQAPQSLGSSALASGGGPVLPIEQVVRPSLYRRPSGRQGPDSGRHY